MKVMLWDDYLKSGAIREKEKFESIQVLFNIKEEPEFGSLFEVDGVVYGICSVSRKEDYVMVMKINGDLGENRYSSFSDEITCPNCNESWSDSFEADDNGTDICDYCGTEYRYSRDIDVSYSSSVVQVGKDPIKIEKG